MFPSPCTSMKGSDSRQPGNCSALLPSSALFPQPFLAAQQPLAQHIFPVPSSSWRKVRVKGLASLCGCILKSPSMARAAADHQNPISPPWHTGLCSTLSCSEPWAPGRGPAVGQSWLFPYTAMLWLQSQSQSRDAPLPYTLPIPASLCDYSEPLHLTGWEHKQLRHQATPRHRAELFPTALGYAAIWHQATLLCYKEYIQIKQLTGFCSFPLFPIQN